MHNQHVRLKAQSKKQNQKSQFFTGQLSVRLTEDTVRSSERAWTEESKSIDYKYQQADAWVLDADSKSTSIGSNLQIALDLSFSNLEDKMPLSNIWVCWVGTNAWWNCLSCSVTVWQAHYLAGIRLLAGTRLGSSWWQAPRLAGTGAWFMLVAGTILGRGLVHVGDRHSTWQEHGTWLGSCWWQAQYSIGERPHRWVDFIKKNFSCSFADLK